MTVPYVEPQTCPYCGGDLRGSRAIGIEIAGVYDGVLFWACPDCGCTWNRWDPVRDPRRWAAAEEHRAAFVLRERSVS